MELPPKYASAVLHLDKNKKQKQKQIDCLISNDLLSNILDLITMM
jgi:hypothetical protein